MAIFSPSLYETRNNRELPDRARPACNADGTATDLHTIQHPDHHRHPYHHRHPNCHRHPDEHCHPHPFGNTHSDRDTDGDRDTDENCDLHTYEYPYTH